MRAPVSCSRRARFSTDLRDRSMATAENVLLPQLIAKHRDALLSAWLDQQRAANRGSSEDQAELRDYSPRFLDSLRTAATTGQFEDITTASWSEARHVLEEVSRARASRGGTPTQTATFVFSLKSPLFELLGRECGKDAGALAREVWLATTAARQARPLHDRGLPEEPRRGRSGASRTNCSSCRRRSSPCGKAFSLCR